MTPVTRVQVVLAVLAATLACAAPASAATLTNAGGTLTYTGTAAKSDVDFVRTAADTVLVDRDALDTDPFTGPLPPPGCTEEVAGDSYTCSGVTSVTARGEAGDDVLDGSLLADVPMSPDGGEGDDRLSSGDGRDDPEGGAGDDVIAAGGGSDRLLAGAGADTLAGGDGDDVLAGGEGDDLLRGDGGDDLLVGDEGDDDVAGGTGYDLATGPVASATPAPIAISLDDAAGDRQSGGATEDDNVHSDVEGIDVEFPAFTAVPPSAGDALTGNAAANSIAGGAGGDTIDGGPGNDVLAGGDGGDTIQARDGYADVVSCGAGTDAVVADALDLLQECEDADVTDVGSATEDRPPTVELTAPAAEAVLPSSGTTMTATATDDRGIAQVLFLDDDRIACADAEAPYACDYAPRGEDVGRNTLVAVAFDTAQQTATVTRTFRVRRFVPTITAAVTPARDRRRPFRFVTSGRLNLPDRVSREAGCDGRVRVQVKAGGRTISSRRAKVRRDCQFGSVVSFARRKRFGPSGLLRFVVRFGGSAVLGESLPVSRYVRTRRAGTRRR